MTKQRINVLKYFAVLLVLLFVIILNCGCVEKRAHRHDDPYTLGTIQKFRGEVLFISKHEDGYIIYMDQREYQPNSLMEFYIHQGTTLSDYENGDSIRRLLEAQETGWIALIGSFDPTDEVLEGHTVRPVGFIMDKTPTE